MEKYDIMSVDRIFLLRGVCLQAFSFILRHGTFYQSNSKKQIDQLKGALLMKFYECSHCHNIIAYVKSSGVPVVCCGEPMKELIPNTTDAAGEKHVPVIQVDGNKVTVTVGSVEHPMLDAHYIMWIALETKQGNQRKELHPGEKPRAEFMISDGDEVVAAYEYCNLHGLWMAEA